MFLKSNEEISEKLYRIRQLQDNPVGYVQLFDEKKKVLFEGCNLVVGLGRQYVNQVIVTTSLDINPIGLSLTDLPSGCANLREYELTHYAFGSGGATYTGIDTYQLTGPAIGDTNLSRPITHNVSTYLTDPGNIDELDDLHMSLESVKPINMGNNTYEYVLVNYPPVNPTCSYYTQLQLTLYKETGEFGSLLTGQNVQVSEAGLYITNGSSTLLFARICFPPKFMEKEAQYGLQWNILC
jgi:hypothetical protein